MADSLSKIRVERIIVTCFIILVVVAGIHICLNTVMLYNLNSTTESIKNSSNTALDHVRINQELLLKNQKQTDSNTELLNKRTAIIGDLSTKIDILQTKLEQIDKFLEEKSQKP